MELLQQMQVRMQWASSVLRVIGELFYGAVAADAGARMQSASSVNR